MVHPETLPEQEALRVAAGLRRSHLPTSDLHFLIVFPGFYSSITPFSVFVNRCLGLSLISIRKSVLLDENLV